LLPTFDAKATEEFVREHWEKVNLQWLLQKELGSSKV
jgi:hypothetical protein